MDVATLKAVQKLAAEAQDLKGLRATLDVLIPRVEAENSARFNETLAHTQEALGLIRTHCIGCTTLVKEGPRSYEADAPATDGVCSQCGKPRVRCR